MAEPRTRAPTRALERLPMTMGYFRLILRCFGDTPARRAAILAGTGVSEAELTSATAEISLFQQVRQVENVNRVAGAGWALSQPELWNPTAHGALGVAVLSAPTLAEGLNVLARCSRARAPFFRLHLRPRKDGLRLDYELTADLTEAQWRPMMEITFISIRALCAAVIGRAPDDAEFRFACAEPSHSNKLADALGPNIRFGEKMNRVVIPKAWAAIPSAFSDASLFRGAVAELEAALERLETPNDLRARVERLLHTMPERRLNAEQAARALGVSHRTLARRLQAVGTPFRDLLDAELKERASALIAAGTLSRADMAERLGYRDPTSFSRACRRWFAE